VASSRHDDDALIVAVLRPWSLHTASVAVIATVPARTAVAHCSASARESPANASTVAATDACNASRS
jgi:hypothetical protein